MERDICITLRYDLQSGNVSLNEIVYWLNENQDKVMLAVLEEIIKAYDDHIAERLTRTDVYPSKARKGLGKHLRKDDRERYCRGRKARKRGHRSKPRMLSTVFGGLEIQVREVECFKCGARYSPVLNALEISSYSHKETNFEKEVIEAVIDTNYRRLIDGRSIDISLGGIHNIVAGVGLESLFHDPVSTSDLSALMADGTGVKQQGGRKGELRAVIGVTKSGCVKPLGCFVNTNWELIEKTVKERIKEVSEYGIPFIYDGEPALDNFLANVAESQRCTWHGPRGLYHALWEDGLKKKDSQPETDKIRQLVAIELPEADYELLTDEDKELVQAEYEESKSRIQKLIGVFKENGYKHGASYLESLSKRLFTNIEIWLKTGVIAPKTTSLLERMFREIGRRIKKIAWGWSDKVVTNLSKMIVIRQYSRGQWEQYWKVKLGIRDAFRIEILAIESRCRTF
jgi:hypothetical protein